MFIAINNKDMTVPQVLDWINRTKKDNGNVISPEFAMEILGKTNFYGHIKVVLKNIKENCKTREDIEPYKDFILSCVDRREMSDQAMAVLQELAETGGFKDEFDKTNDKVKIYEVKDCENTDVKIIKSEREFQALEGEDLRVFYDADKLDMSYCNLGFIKSIKFREGATASIQGAYMLPKELDLSMCSKVDFIDCNFEGVEKLKFREDTCVNLWGSSNLPKNLDVSMCSCVFLCKCNLTGFSFKFREGAVVNLGYAKNLPKDLDVSMCDVVVLWECDLEGLNLKFREGAEVTLEGAENLPKDLDVSMCSKVYLNGCNLKGVEKIKFREGAAVYLHRAQNLPKDLDVSICSKVDMTDCDLEGVEKIKFKNRKQKSEFMKGAKNFSGEIEYEESAFNKISKVFNKEM